MSRHDDGNSSNDIAVKFLTWSGIAFALSLVAVVFFAFFWRPYDKPTFAEVGSNETAFLIPLFVDSKTKTTDQVKIDSTEFYRQHMVSDKLFQIPHKWIQEGRFPRQGKYVDTVKVIKVSRTPISGTWIQDTPTAIKLETKESSGFQIPMAYTIKIKAEDCATYLYNYSPNKQLQEVIDTNINKWIVGQMNERFHKLSYLEISANKDQIINEVVSEAKTYFAERGITIESMTAFDGVYYDSADLQLAINNQVNAQATQNAKDEELRVVEKQRLIDIAKAEAKAKVQLIEAQKERDIANLKASTMNVLKMQQEIENSKILAQAQADAIKIAAGKGTSVPGGAATHFTLLNSGDLKSLGLGSNVINQN